MEKQDHSEEALIYAIGKSLSTRKIPYETSRTFDVKDLPQDRVAIKLCTEEAKIGKEHPLILIIGKIGITLTPTQSGLEARLDSVKDLELRARLVSGMVREYKDVIDTLDEIKEKTSRFKGAVQYLQSIGFEQTSYEVLSSFALAVDFSKRVYSLEDLERTLRQYSIKKKVE